MIRSLRHQSWTVMTLTYYYVVRGGCLGVASAANAGMLLLTTHPYALDHLTDKQFETLVSLDIIQPIFE